MAIETVLSCPLGHKCEEVREGKIHRCAWFIRLQGKDPQSEEVKDEHACAIAWFPILLVENTGVNKGTTSALESFRNEMVRANLATTQLLLSSKK